MLSDLEALNYDPQSVETDLEGLVKALVRDVLAARGAAVEAERRVEQQVTDIQAAFEKVCSIIFIDFKYFRLLY